MTRLAHPRTLIVVLVLPLLVVGLGMWALSGRVDRLDAVPAAVVNLDEGAEVEDADGEVETVPFGRLLAGALTQPGTIDGQETPETTGFDWRLTDEEDAEQGLKDGSYSAVVVIPADFSKDLATIGTPEATQAILEVTTNDASGQINALVGTAVADASASTMGGQMAEQYLDGLYLGFNELGDGFSDAADGARDLADGTSELGEGADELSGGTRELADGTTEAAEGARQFSGGVWTFADGTWQAADGTRALADGLGDLATGAEDLSDGVGELQQGMRGAEGQPGLLDGAEQLASGVEGTAPPRTPGSPRAPRSWPAGSASSPTASPRRAPRSPGTAPPRIRASPPPHASSPRAPRSWARARSRRPTASAAPSRSPASPRARKESSRMPRGSTSR